MLEPWREIFVRKVASNAPPTSAPAAPAASASKQQVSKRDNKNNTIMSFMSGGFSRNGKRATQRSREGGLPLFNALLTRHPGCQAQSVVIASCSASHDLSHPRALEYHCLLLNTAIRKAGNYLSMLWWRKKHLL